MSMANHTSAPAAVETETIDLCSDDEDDSSKQLAALQAENKALKEWSSKLETRLAKASREKDKPWGGDDARKEVLVMKDALSRSNGEKQELKKTIDDLKTKHKSEVGDLNLTYSSEIAELRLELSSTKGALSCSNEEKQELETTIVNLKTKHEFEVADLNLTYSSEIAELRSQLSSTKVALAGSNGQKEKLEITIADLKTKHEFEVADLNLTYSSEIAELRSQLSSTKVALAGSNGQKEKLEITIADLKTKFESTISATAAELSTTQESLARTSEEKQELKMTVASLMNELSATKDAKARISEEEQVFQKKLFDLPRKCVAATAAPVAKAEAGLGLEREPKVAKVVPDLSHDSMEEEADDEGTVEDAEEEDSSFFVLEGQVFNDFNDYVAAKRRRNQRKLDELGLGVPLLQKEAEEASEERQRIRNQKTGAEIAVPLVRRRSSRLTEAHQKAAASPALTNEQEAHTQVTNITMDVQDVQVDNEKEVQLQANEEESVGGTSESGGHLGGTTGEQRGRQTSSGDEDVAAAAVTTSFVDRAALAPTSEIVEQSRAPATALESSAVPASGSFASVRPLYTYAVGQPGPSVGDGSTAAAVAATSAKHMAGASASRMPIYRASGEQQMGPPASWWNGMPIYYYGGVAKKTGPSS